MLNRNEYEDGFVPVSSTPFDVEEKQNKENNTEDKKYA